MEVPATISAPTEILDACPDLICRLDADGTVLFANAAWQTVLGHRPRQVVGHALDDYLAPEDPPRGLRPGLMSPLVRRLDGRRCRMLHADGSRRPVLWAARRDGRYTTASGRDLSAHGGGGASAADRESELQAAIDTMTANVAVLAQDGRIIAVNDAWEQFARSNGGITERTGVGANYLDACDRAVGEPVAFEVASALRDVLAGRRREFSREYPCHSPSEERWFRVRAVRSEGARARAVVGHENITIRRRAAEGLRLRSAVLRGIDTPVVVMTPDSTILEWNPAAEDLYGWSASEVRGRRWVAMQDPGCERVLDTLIAEGHVNSERELRCRDGSRVVVALHGMRVDDDDGAPVAVVTLAFDLTARVAAERALRGTRDFLRAVTEEMGEGLLTLDDSGHVTFANHAACQLLERDEPDLLGQVLHDVAHVDMAGRETHAREECPLQQACEDHHALSVDDDVFVRRGGGRLEVEYAASPFVTGDEGSGLVVVFSDISVRKARERELLALVDRAETVSTVRQALRDGRLVLHAQPIISLRTRATVQHELLLRMETAEGGIVPPGAFLPAVELVGLMRDVDRWVIGQSIGLAAAGTRVQLNLSAASVSDPGLFDEITTEIDARGADPELMVFELTETGILRDQTAARRFVQRIERFGAHVALDDFGTGYSSMTYLKHLPVSFLKIDIGFVRDLATSDASRHVVRAMVDLARSFELQTIAEGVEDVAVLEVLAELGVDFAQGYAIGVPVPLPDAFGQRT